MADKNCAAEEKLEENDNLENSPVNENNTISKKETDEENLLSEENVSVAEEIPDPEPVIEITVCDDDAPKKTSPESSLQSASNVSDGNVSSQSTSAEERSAIDEHSEDVHSKKTVSTECSTEPSVSRQKPISEMSYRSLFMEHNFNDSSDDSSRRLRVDKYQSILESLRDEMKPKEIDVSKAVSKRRKRQRSTTGILDVKSSPSKTDFTESSNRIEDSSSSSAPCPLPSLHSSESLQVVEEPVATAVPTEVSSDRSSNTEPHKTEAASDKAESVQIEPVVEKSVESSSNAKSDSLSILKYDATKAIQKCCEAMSKETTDSCGKKSSSDPLSILKYDPSRVLNLSSKATGASSTDSLSGKKSSTDSLSGKKSSTDSLSILKYDPSEILRQSREKAIAKCNRPHVSRCSEETAQSPVPIQTPRDVILAESLSNHPHERRINSLTSLIDRLVDFTNYMSANPLLTIPSGTNSAAALPFTPASLTTLHELQAAFRRGFEALQEDTSDSDDTDMEAGACADYGFRQSVRDIKNYLRLLIDGIAYSDSDLEETVPPSNQPVTIEELRDQLPRLWRDMGHNNMLMGQWTATLLDWCLQPVPEYLPQQFYDAEQGIRSLYGRIDDVRRSTARLMYRWRSRRMDYDELGDLTHLMTMASTAMSMYSIIESEVINLRYVMGTRYSYGNRRRPRDDSDQSDSDDSVNAKKGKKDI